MDLFSRLQTLAQSDAAAQASRAVDPARLDHLLRFLAESFPSSDQAQALRFTLRLLVQLSLIMKRSAHGLHDGPLTPADRLLLAQQEQDYLVLSHLAEALYPAVFARDFGTDAREHPLTITAADQHHPQELDPHDPWVPALPWVVAVTDATAVLVEAWKTGALAGTQLETRHTLIPGALAMIAGSDPTQQEAVRLGYCFYVARAAGHGQLAMTANRMLNPEELLRALPESMPASFECFALAPVLPRLGIAEPARRAAFAQGYWVGVLEESLVSPLPAGR